MTSQNAERDMAALVDALSGLDLAPGESVSISLPGAWASPEELAKKVKGAYRSIKGK